MNTLPKCIRNVMDMLIKKRAPGTEGHCVKAESLQLDTTMIDQHNQGRIDLKQINLGIEFRSVLQNWIIANASKKGGNYAE